jgi:flagellar biosynthesis/type III secretory pathway M-ring protein FliF/YscJ
MFQAFIDQIVSFFKFCLEQKWRVLGAVVLCTCAVALAIVWSERAQIVGAMTGSAPAPSAAASK